MKLRNCKVLGVCGGNGVILHPFKKNLIANVEPRPIFYTKEDRQWRANFGDIPMVKKVHPGIESPDIIIGAPDCGHSSVLSYSRRKKFGEAKDNESLNLFFESIITYQPSFWLMENLPALLTQIPKDELRATFENYKLLFIVGSVSKLGNSQANRERLLIVGINTNKVKLVKPLKAFKLSLVNPLLTTSELIADLSGIEDFDMGHVREDINSVITMYSRFKISLRDAQKKWNDNPRESRWVVEDRNFTTAPGVYRNLPDRPPNTARKANRQFNPEGLTLTPRELARIQGVPDSFKIITLPTNTGYWINKGRATVTKTPPYEVGVWFKQCLKLLKTPLDNTKK